MIEEESYKLYKNPEYLEKKNKKQARGRSSKNNTTAATFVTSEGVEVVLKINSSQILVNESKEPKLKFCDITGFETKNTDPKLGINYLDRFVYKYIRQLPKSTIDEFKFLRGIPRSS